MSIFDILYLLTPTLTLPQTLYRSNGSLHKQNQLENGETFVFKPARDEDPDEERPANVPETEVAV